MGDGVTARRITVADLPPNEAFLCQFWRTVTLDLRAGRMDARQWLDSESFRRWASVTTDRLTPAEFRSLLLAEHWRVRVKGEAA